MFVHVYTIGLYLTMYVFHCLMIYCISLHLSTCFLLTCYNYYLIDCFQVGTVLCQLEYHKRHAIEREDYDEAKKWKVLILNE